MKAFFDLFRDFPEWSQLDNFLEKAAAISAKALQSYDIAHGPKFTDFARRHPEQVAEVLFRIEELLRRAREAHVSSYEALTTARSDFAVVRPLHAAIVRLRKETARVVQQSEKSQAAEAALVAKLGMARARADQAAIGKLEAQLSTAQQEAQQNLNQRLEKEQQLSVEETKYREAVFSAVLVALKKFAIARNEAAKKMIAVGIELKPIGASIPLPEDSSISKLQTEVQTLEREITELQGQKEQLASSGSTS
jgi:hypothetical protein